MFGCARQEASSGMISSGGQTETGDDPAALARALEPAIRDTCQGRLSEIEWFRATWQRGGAATGFAKWRNGSGDVPVIVKIPVGYNELSWTVQLGDHGLDRDVVNGQVPHPTPRVLSSGTELGGHDLAWLVIERLEGKPVAGDLSERSLNGLLRAAVEFQARAERERGAFGKPPETPDWEKALDDSRQWVRDNHIENASRWKKAIQGVQKLLPRLVSKWEVREINAWCHGDLHPGNVIHMPADEGHPDRCVLIDLALTHAGHWVEDAVYLEHLFWGHDEKLFGVKPVKQMRRLRKERGLRVGEDDSVLADIKRLLIASTTPSFLKVGGDTLHAHGALVVAEGLVKRLSGLQ